MGKIMIGAIQSKTPTFIPSPEPISGLAKMAGMLATSSSRSSSRSSDKEEKLPDLLPGHELAIRQQKAQIDQSEANLQAYAMNEIKTTYGGDVRKFITGESAKYKKDGSGFYGKREAILAAEEMNKVNITAGKQDKILWDKSMTNLGDNQTEGDYFYDPSGGGRVQQGTDENSNPVYYKNQDWLNDQASRLGINSKTGALQRVTFAFTFKSGELQKQIMSIVKEGAANQEISQVLGANGGLVDVKTNRGTLRDNNNTYQGLAQNVYGLLDRQAKSELRNEFDLFFDQNNLISKDAEGMTKAEQKTAMYNMYIIDKVSPAARLLERYSEKRASGKSGEGASEGASEKGIIRSYLDREPTSLAPGNASLEIGANGMLTYNQNPTTKKMNSIDPKWRDGTNNAYMNGIKRNQGTTVESTGDYFWTADGVPNKTNVFAGTTSYILGVNEIGESRTPVGEAIVEDGKPFNGYALNSPTKIYDQLVRSGSAKGPSTLKKAQEMFAAKTEETLFVDIAVAEKDINTVLKRLRTYDTDHKSSTKGTIRSGATSMDKWYTFKDDPVNKITIKDAGGEDQVYYKIPARIRAGNLATYEDKSDKKNMNVGIGSTNQHIINEDQSAMDAQFN